MLAALGGALRHVGPQLVQPGALAALISTTSEALNAAAAAAPATKAKPGKPPLYKEFQLYRWNPDGTEKPKYVSYQVDINNCGPMMLDVLLKVKDEQDQTLSFRRSCRRAARRATASTRRASPPACRPALRTLWPGHAGAAVPVPNVARGKRTAVASHGR